MKRSRIGLKRISYSVIGILFVCMFVCLLNLNEAQAKSSKYYIKVNKNTNVATVYNSSDKKPVKAFRVSTGYGTPTGTFYTKSRYRWRPLIHNVHGQYATRITGSILFHSVWYYKSGDKTSQSIKEYNKLGTTASAGCVRLTVADSKWIYDNCKIGTKVIIFKGKSKDDPLGKPKLKKGTSKGQRGWDPTDPDKKNPYNKISYSGIKSGTKTKEVGTTINVLKGVKSKTKIGKDLTSKITVTVKDAGTDVYKKSTAKTLKLTKKGKYIVKYKVKDGTTGLIKTLTAKYKVKDSKPASFSGIPMSAEEELGEMIDVKTKVKAKDGFGKDLSDKISIEILKPNKTSYEKLQGTMLQLEIVGVYKVKYKVTNPENGKLTERIIQFTCVNNNKDEKIENNVIASLQIKRDILWG